MPLAGLLLADDLPGACDAAVHFALRGYRTAAALSLDHAAGIQADVLAVSLDSRDLPREEIAALFARAAALFPPGSTRILFKKIDSTLRGSPGAEIAAARDAFGCSRVIVTPALPAMGRVVRNGQLSITYDPSFATIDVVRLLESQGLTGATVADAATDADLDRLAREQAGLWAGSAGLAAALARALPAWGSPPCLGIQPAQTIFCIGSDHRVTLEQTAALAATRPNPILRIARGVAPDLPAGPLFLCGGDTASLLCRSLGAHSIELHGEIVPGLPHGLLRGGPHDGRPVATKSGGFGQPGDLIRVADFYSCANQ